METRYITFMWMIIIAVLVLTSYNLATIYFLNQKVNILEKEVSEANSPVQLIRGASNGEALAPEKTIPIVAVSNSGGGMIGSLTLKLIPGDENVLVDTSPFIEPDLQESVNEAVEVAKSKVHSSPDYDFVFDYEAGEAQLIGGGSAGAATTIIAIAALQNKELKNDAVITGTIHKDGSIGRVAGVLEKARAVADADYKYFLVPKGQSQMKFYEREVVKKPIGLGLILYQYHYTQKTISLEEAAQQMGNLTVIEVSNIDEALPYFIQE